jgi:predicted nuclease of predicted toxin-antitoxin system
VRFLVDASLSPSVVGSLNDAGHDAVHVGHVLPLNAPDDVVFDAAVEQQRVIVTADTDFGEILARRQASIPSVVLFRTPGGRPSARAQLLLDHLPAAAGRDRGRLTWSAASAEAGVERVADELGRLVVAWKQVAVLVDGRLDRRVAGVAAHEEDRHAGREQR